MNARLLECRSHQETRLDAVLDLLARNDTPALATDPLGHVVSWNRGAERVLGRGASQALGRRCYDILKGRDVFGNLFCHEHCAVRASAGRGEPIHAFELALDAGARPKQRVGVSVMHVPGERPEEFTLVHVLQPIDTDSRLARALERLGARSTPSLAGAPLPAAAQPGSPKPIAQAEAPPLTEREREVLRWVATGLQNKEVAQKLGISLATVRNHIHSILEKLEVHSKLEAVSLAFRSGWVRE